MALNGHLSNMKFISWNVNGLRAVCGKGFADIFTELDADFFCLQETKLQEGQIDLEFLGYRSFWNYADKKGYSGTAIYTKHDPISVTYGIGIDEHDHEGRVITLEMEDFYLVCVYVPNAQDELKRLEYRMKWEDDFRVYVSGLAQKEHAAADGSSIRKGVIICGDLNVAHEEIDLARPAANHFSAGFSDEERAGFTELLGAGFADTFRRLHPDARDAYSWWSFRGGARARNVGWRIDYFCVSEPLLPRVQSAEIHADITGSDHCPVSITLN